MPEHYWVDTNVILRFITQSPDEHAKLATKIMEGVDTGQFILHVHPLIIAECCYVLQGKIYNLPHKQIAHILRELIMADGIEAEQEQILLKAFDYYDQQSIDFEDAYLAAHAETHSHRGILTFNMKDFAHTSVNSYTPTDLISGSYGL
jgi:predicted nucleic acid-binding protein